MGAILIVVIFKIDLFYYYHNLRIYHCIRILNHGRNNNRHKRVLTIHQA